MDGYLEVLVSVALPDATTSELQAFGVRLNGLADLVGLLPALDAPTLSSVIVIENQLDLKVKVSSELPCPPGWWCSCARRATRCASK